jgi:hypothetical protein
MPVSKAEQILDALKALFETLPDAVVERNSVLPEKIPDGGLIILRDGDPASQSRRSAASGMRTTGMRSRLRSTSRRAMQRYMTLPSTLSSSRSVLRSTLIRPSAT